MVKNTKFEQKTVSLLCVKTKTGAHKQLTFYFQMRKYFAGICTLVLSLCVYYYHNDLSNAHAAAVTEWSHAVFLK